MAAAGIRSRTNDIIAVEGTLARSLTCASGASFTSSECQILLSPGPLTVVGDDIVSKKFLTQ